MFGLFCLNPAIAAWSNVFWNVEPEPFSVVLEDPLLPPDPLLLELPHAAARSARRQKIAAARTARRCDNDAVKSVPLVRRKLFGGGEAGAGLASMSRLRTTHGC